MRFLAALQMSAKTTRSWEEEEEEYNLRGAFLVISMSCTHQIGSTVIPIVISKSTHVNPGVGAGVRLIDHPRCRDDCIRDDGRLEVL
jgi:hypothetical protein